MDGISDHIKDCSALNEQRRQEIAALIENRTAFSDDALWAHRPILRTRTKSRRNPFAREKVEEVQLEPIAFTAHVSGCDMGGIISMRGTMTAYLALHPHGCLMRKTDQRSKKGDLIWIAIDPYQYGLLSEEDVENIRIGTSGNNELLEQQYQKAHDEVMKKLGYDES